MQRPQTKNSNRQGGNPHAGKRFNNNGQGGQYQGGNNQGYSSNGGNRYGNRQRYNEESSEYSSGQGHQAHGKENN